MAGSSLSLPILSILLVLFFNSGGVLKLANGQQMKTWCVAKASSSDAELSANINFACSNIGVMGLNCKMIEEGGACFSPNCLSSHASVVMNLYYQIMGRNPWNCNFTCSALITTTDPSYGSCHYA